MYRLLRDNCEVGDRRHHATHPARKKEDRSAWASPPERQRALLARRARYHHRVRSEHGHPVRGDHDRLNRIERYAAHWSIEVAIETAKQLGGVGQARNRLERAMQRTVHFAFG